MFVAHGVESFSGGERSATICESRACKEKAAGDAVRVLFPVSMDYDGKRHLSLRALDAISTALGRRREEMDH
jgi:hypothetical protein